MEILVSLSDYKLQSSFGPINVALMHNGPDGWILKWSSKLTNSVTTASKIGKTTFLVRKQVGDGQPLTHQADSAVHALRYFVINADTHRVDEGVEIAAKKYMVDLIRQAEPSVLASIKVETQVKQMAGLLMSTVTVGKQNGPKFKGRLLEIIPHKRKGVVEITDRDGSKKNVEVGLDMIWTE